MNRKCQKVLHLEIDQPDKKKETERARVTLIDNLRKGCFSRKNTRSLEQIKKEKNEEMFLTGSQFFKKQSRNRKRPATGVCNPSLTCSAIFSKGIIASPTTTKSCFEFFTDRKPRAHSQTGKSHILRRIQQYNNKMITQSFCVEEEQNDFIFKRQSTPKTHWDLFRFDEMKKRGKNKGNKDIGQKKGWEAKRKGINCHMARKKMKELEIKCQLDAWDVRGHTEQVDY